jgi:hypothetical protein
MSNVVRFRNDDKLLAILQAANLHQRERMSWEDCKREVIAVLTQMKRSDIEALTMFLYPMTHPDFRQLVLDWLDEKVPKS